MWERSSHIMASIVEQLEQVVDLQFEMFHFHPHPMAYHDEVFRNFPKFSSPSLQVHFRKMCTYLLIPFIAKKLERFLIYCSLNLTH
jgi:hypothetical protein